PNAAGTKFTNAIKAGVPASAGTFKWIPDNIHNTDSLTVVVFLQNEDTKEVYQAFIKTVKTPTSVVTGIEPISVENIKVYPNPSDQEFTIELSSPAQESLKLTMANQVGQFTEVGAIGEGEQSKKISTQGLAEGVYILQLGSNGNALRTKVVVLHK
ncbi:MAG TPA: T9SS type A sorting domain-containing protein, partial [Cyclobacteriaceae bacterium]|nr:T9SS type A sorting domain-containing protein [Cyclobacteriaceae bacterium]